MKLKCFDFVVFFALLSVCIAGAFFIYSGTYGGDANVVIKGESGQWIFPLGTNEEIVVKGPLGVTVVKTGIDGARVFSSPCKNQTCVACSAIKENMQWIACLPNRVIITIENSRKEKLDAALW